MIGCCKTCIHLDDGTCDPIGGIGSDYNPIDLESISPRLKYVILVEDRIEFCKNCQFRCGQKYLPSAWNGSIGHVEQEGLEIVGIKPGRPHSCDPDPSIQDETPSEGNHHE